MNISEELVTQNNCFCSVRLTFITPLSCGFILDVNVAVVASILLQPPYYNACPSLGKLTNTVHINTCEYIYRPAEAVVDR